MMRIRSGGVLALALVTALSVTPAAAPAGAGAPDLGAPPEPPSTVPDRYDLAGGCYVLRSAPTGAYVARSAAGFAATAPTSAHAEAFHLRATDLGQYLLFGTAADFLAADEHGTVIAGGSPSPAADWVVEPRPTGGFTLRLPEADGGRTLWASAGGSLRADGAAASVGPPSSFAFEPAEGCAAFPEVELNVTGPVARGTTPYEEARGYIDGHNHLMAFEFLGGGAHCGRPWHRYGVTHALVDCPDHVPLDGLGAVLENFLSRDDPVATHDPVGWPTFRDWPAPSSLTHEQTYYRWIERAWRGGLRLMVNLFVENRVLCEVYPIGDNRCDEMASVRLQAQRIRELERYIDAQSGGPGEGWFRIVDDPFEARRVANDGKLAVVLGIEVSELFGCSLLVGQPQCSTADIDRWLDEVHAAGVRQLLLVNKFDNALSGVMGDGGTFGVVVNVGNFLGTGQFWHMVTCDPADTGDHDRDQLRLPGGITDQDTLFGGILSLVAPTLALPLYPEPHHCNVRGLSPLGAHTIDGIVERGMILDADHMSTQARRQALDLVEAHRHSGVFSSHSWASPETYRRIYPLGGVTTPYAGDSTGFVEEWRERRAWADPRFYWGIGYGADNNGFGSQGGPRGAGAENPVTYPFEGLGGVVVDRQVSGQRTYDVNVDGVAHYGLYPDWIEDLRRQAGDEIVEDMARGAEAYLQMWERAEGVAATSCGPAAAVDALVPGMTPEAVLRAVGQPRRRLAATFGYCVTAADGHPTERTVYFDATGRLVQVAGAARGPGATLPATGPAGGTGGAASAAALAVLALLAGRLRSRRRVPGRRA